MNKVENFGNILLAKNCLIDTHTAGTGSRNSQR